MSDETPLTPEEEADARRNSSELRYIRRFWATLDESRARVANLKAAAAQLLAVWTSESQKTVDEAREELRQALEAMP
jgi:hypothetical protein